jgi:hypothetical protein
MKPARWCKPAALKKHGKRNDMTAIHSRPNPINGLTIEQFAEALGATHVRSEWLALCPAHPDTHPSLSIKQGDSQIIFTCRVGCTNDQIIAVLKGRGLWPLTAHGASTKNEGVPHERQLKIVKPETDADEWEPVSPVPASPVALGVPILPTPTFRWGYLDADGRLLFGIDRIDPAIGRKHFLPLSFWRSKKTSRYEWRRKGVPSPRPLYGLDRLAASPELPVLVVEGEKCADAAGRLVRTYVAVSMSGGCGGVRHADWTPLAGRRVVIWPDADAPGRAAALEIKAILDKQAPETAARVIDLPDTFPQHFDVADAETEGWSPSQTVAFIEAGSVLPGVMVQHGSEDDPLLALQRVRERITGPG